MCVNKDNDRHFKLYINIYKHIHIYECVGMCLCDGVKPPLCHLSYASLPLSSMQLVLWGRPRSAWMSWKALETGWCAMRSFLSCYSPKVVILMCGLKVVFCYVLLFRVCVCVCCRALPHDLSYSQSFPLLLNEACISKMTLFLSPCSFIKSRNTILKCFQKNL